MSPHTLPQTPTETSGRFVIARAALVLILTIVITASIITMVGPAILLIVPLALVAGLVFAVRRSFWSLICFGYPFTFGFIKAGISYRPVLGYEQTGGFATSIGIGLVGCVLIGVGLWKALPRDVLEIAPVADDELNGRALAFRLVLSHFVAGLTLCAVSCMNTGPHLAVAALGGLVFAQTSLLGLWGGLGTGNWMVRWTSVVIGLAYLGMLFSVGVRDSRDLTADLVFMFVFAGLVVTGLLGICLFIGFRIRAIDDDSSEATVSQFSIRQLLQFTLVVACLTAVATWLPLDMRAFPALALVSSPFVILGLVAVWGILATSHPRLSVVAVSVLAPALGFGLKAFPYGGRASFWITATTTAALALVVSLYAIRWCGFRVGRPSKGDLAFEGEKSHREDERSSDGSDATL